MVEDDIVGRIVRLSDFLQHDRTLAPQFGFVEGRMLQQVGDDVDGQRDILFQNAGVIGGVFPRGIGVHLPADRLDLLGDLLGVAARRAFEQHVFQQMGDAVLGSGLVARAAAGPDADRRAFDMGHRVGGDAQAIGQGRDPDRGGHAVARR